MPTGGGGGGGIKGWPVAYFFLPTNAGASQILGAANRVMVFGTVLPAQVIVNNITINVNIADAVNLYDVGLYTQAGALALHIGAQSLPATGIHTFAVVGAPVTLSPGNYAFAFTGNATTATLACDTGPAWTWITNTNVATSAAGVLPASIGALSAAIGQFPPAFALT